MLGEREPPLASSLNDHTAADIAFLGGFSDGEDGRDRVLEPLNSSFKFSSDLSHTGESLNDHFAADNGFCDLLVGEPERDDVLEEGLDDGRDLDRFTTSIRFSSVRSFSVQPGGLDCKCLLDLLEESARACLIETSLLGDPGLLKDLLKLIGLEDLPRAVKPDVKSVFLGSKLVFSKQGLLVI